MNKRMTFITGAFISLLLTTVMAPMAAAKSSKPDGSLTLYNENCTKVIGFKKRKRVSVHIYDPGKRRSCTNRTITLDIGEQQTITLKGGSGEQGCRYKHEARGTVYGFSDVKGWEHSSVICKKDSISVCQCIKD